MGRLKDTRKRFSKFAMTEGEERAFQEYFKGWKTNREVSKGMLTESSVKNIDTSIGRYSNKFLKRKWVHKERQWFVYEYVNRFKKKVKQKQKVPSYRGTIEPFISYFFGISNDYQLSSLKESAISTLNLFFELQEVRDSMLFLHPFFYTSRFSLYELFLRTIEDKLVYSWLYFEGKFHPSIKNIVKADNMFVGKLPNLIKLKKLVKQYIKDERSEYDKLEERTKLVNDFNLAWNELVNKKEFQTYFKLKKKFFDKTFTKEYILNDLKIEFFARLLYSKSDKESIIKSFLRPLTKELIFATENPKGIKSNQKLDGNTS